MSLSRNLFLLHMFLKFKLFTDFVLTIIIILEMIEVTSLTISLTCLKNYIKNIMIFSILRMLIN